MKHIQEKRWILDAVLFLGFLACFFLDLTGVGLHQWIGVAAGVLAGYHLITHWSWVKAVTARFFGNTSSQAREFYMIDMLLYAGFLAMLGTGLAISTWLNLSLADYTLWRFAHIMASIGTLLILTLKIGLHMRWIISIGQKLFGTQPQPTLAGTPAQAAVDRRTFLKGMGVAGVASAFAFSKSLQALDVSAPATDTPVSNQVTAAAASPTTSASSGARSASLSPSTSTGSTSTSTTCVLRCNKGCSYPGRCRRYTDSNKDGKCDLSQCLS